MAKTETNKKLEGKVRERQIPLVLPVEPSISRDDLLESPANQLAVDLVDSWPDWPSNVMVLAGPVGSGKTHLAHIWAQNSGAKFLQMGALLNAQPNFAGTNLVLEDAVSGQIDEEALFHAFNQVKASGKHILITSRSFPASWGITLPDLASRLKLAHVVELQEPDDPLLAGIIFKLFADRQLEVSQQVVDYLVARMERSMGAAGQLVEWIDREALANHRKINRSLASDALREMELG